MKDSILKKIATTIAFSAAIMMGANGLASAQDNSKQDRRAQERAQNPAKQQRQEQRAQAQQQQQVQAQQRQVEKQQRHEQNQGAAQQQQQRRGDQNPPQQQGSGQQQWNDRNRQQGNDRNGQPQWNDRNGQRDNGGRQQNNGQPQWNDRNGQRDNGGRQQNNGQQQWNERNRQGNDRNWQQGGRPQIPERGLRDQELARQRREQFQRGFDQRQRAAEQREQFLRQQRRLAQSRFQHEYFERLRQNRLRLNSWNYVYVAPSYRYYRGGQYYQTSSYGASMIRQAINDGYAEGVRAGQADRADGYGFDYDDSFAYQDASFGYDSYYVDLPEYQYYFREGFRRGYEDGYEGRYQYGRYSNGVFSIAGAILQSIFDPRNY